MSNVAHLHGGGVYDQAEDAPSYEMVVSNEPDQDGFYVGSVRLNGAHISGSVTHCADRDTVIQRCKSFAEWHRSHDPSRETIPL